MKNKAQQAPRWSESEQEPPRSEKTKEEETELAPPGPRSEHTKEEAEKAPPRSEETKKDEQAPPPRLPGQGKESAAQGRDEASKKRGRESPPDSHPTITSAGNQQRQANAAFAAAALSRWDQSGKPKPHKKCESQMRQAIHRYMPNKHMKIAHDSVFRQVADTVQSIRGTTVDVSNVTGEAGLRQVLPGGNRIRRGRINTYRAALEFLSSSDT